MYKLISLLILCLTSFVVQAQYGRIDYSESQIREDFEEYKIMKSTTDGGVTYLACQVPFGLVYWVMGDNGRCSMTMFEPNDEQSLNFFVELNNADYVIVSDTEWKCYTKEGILRINLIYGDNGVFFSTQR